LEAPGGAGDAKQPHSISVAGNDPAGKKRRQDMIRALSAILLSAALLVFLSGSSLAQTAKPEHPSKPEHPKAEQVKPENSKAEAAKSEHPKGEPAKPEHPKAQPTKPEHPTGEHPK